MLPFRLAGTASSMDAAGRRSAPRTAGTPNVALPFQFAHWLRITIALAYKLDSLVRVSRREGGRHRCSSERTWAAQVPVTARRFDVISTRRFAVDLPCPHQDRVPRVGACAAVVAQSGPPPAGVTRPALAPNAVRATRAQLSAECRQPFVHPLPGSRFRYL